jgi:hypothetical protein
MLLQKYKTRKAQVKYYEELFKYHPVFTTCDVKIDISKPHYPVVTGTSIATITTYEQVKVVFKKMKVVKKVKKVVVTKAKFYIKLAKFGYSWKVVKKTIDKPFSVKTTVSKPY